MGDVIIRDLDDALIVELKRRAWHQGLPFAESLRRLVIASVESESEEFECTPVSQPPYHVADRRTALRRAGLHA